MLKKLFLALLACMAIAQGWADEPFRNHRYDSFRATPVTEQSIVFVGNSITNMQPWAELFDGVPNVVNRGNSGGFSWEILSNVQSFITKRPAKVFIMIGTNDMNVAGYTPEGVVRNVRQAVKHIKLESPKTQVYVESVMPSANGQRTVTKIQELNRQLKAMAEAEGATYVDFFNDLMGCTDKTQSYDNLHPHVVGTYAWTKVLAPYLGSTPVLPANPTVYNGGQANSYGARASVFGQLPVTSDDILFIGDEFVHSGEWQELLGNPHLLNRGTGWGKWGPNIEYQTTCVPFILKGLSDNPDPKQVLLMIGTQQLASSSANIATLKTNYTACINAIRSKAPSTRITLVSEIPYTATALNASNLVPFNEWLKQTAESMDNVDYVDLYSVLTENNAPIAKYLNSDQYVTGLGYQACARKLAEVIDNCTVMTEEEAEQYYNIVAAREVLSNAIDFIELNGIDIDVEEYYALLADNNATVEAMQAAGAALSESFRPSTGKWYTMSAKRSNGIYFTKAAAGNGFVGSATIDATGHSYWELVAREDGTYDIRNARGYYAVPTATHNVQLNLSTDQPTVGWSLEQSDAIGAFNVTAMVNGTNVNCCMNLTGSNLVYNWITGRAADPGCQVVFIEQDYDPSIQPDTYNVPFNLMTVNEDGFEGAQWWYTLKLKNQWYIYGDAEATRMPLSQMTSTGNPEEQWAFAGSDQKGYTIYNRKYGTQKVLAAPKAMTGSYGQTSYVVLVDADNIPADYEAKWTFAQSTDIADVDGYYMAQLSNSANIVNNNAALGYLAFWNNGKDANSTFVIELAEAILPINLDCGATYRNGTAQPTSWVNSWMSTITEPFQYSFGTSYNNMNASTLGIAVGSSQGPWTFTVNNREYYVGAYSFDIQGGDNGQVITPNGGEAVNLTTSAFTTISWQNNEKGELQASFTYTGANKESTVKNMFVTIRKNTVEPEPCQYLFEYGSPGNTICYRIPAITTARNGNVIAVADYRYGGADIGFGRVSLRYRISKDNGETWGDIKTLQESVQGSYGVNVENNLWAGFGDPCIVADRESDRVMALSCCGNVSYPAGTWAHHQGIAQFYSNDNGETWEVRGTAKNGIACHWKDISGPIYQKFKDGGVDVAAMFVGSGRIFQSRFTKVGDYYRLYCVVLLRTTSQGGLNYVLYSDDFGENWNILGGDNFTYGVSSGDEPKSEELPDGSILLSSRAQGRLFNIFHFTDVAKGEGRWMTQAQSKNSNNGICEQGGNPTNGEIMILPVVRNEDNKKMWMALQSVPFGNGRANVGIYYKALESYNDFNNPANFAKDWDGRHQASFMGSAYSTMTLQHDNHIGFLLEEETFGKAYTIVYKNYTIEQITNEAYSLDADSPIAPYDLTKDGIESLMDGLSFANRLGALGDEAREAILEAIDKFKANPNQENYIDIFNTIDNAPKQGLDVTKLYVIRNTTRGGEGAYALSVNSSKKLISTVYGPDKAIQQWAIVPTETEGYFNLYNPNSKTYVMDLLAKETAMYTSAEASEAGLYKLQPINGDHIAIVNLNPADASYPAIHAPGDQTSRTVCWTAEADASQWFFDRTDIDSGIDDAIASVLGQAQAKAVYDLQGRAVAAPKQGLYIINRKKAIVK